MREGEINVEEIEFIKYGCEGMRRHESARERDNEVWGFLFWGNSFQRAICFPRDEDLGFQLF